jgi:hypothetical protein
MIDVSTRQMRMIATAVAAVVFVATVNDATVRAAETRREGSGDSPRLNVSSMVQQCDVETMLHMTGIIFRHRDSERLMQDVARAWNGRDKAQGNSAACLRRAEVQLYLADALAQGLGNGFDLDVDVKPIATLLRGQVNNADAGLAFTAITGLSYIADASDRKLFAELIRSSSRSRRSSAIQALALDCSPQAKELLLAVADPGVLTEAAKYSTVREARCASSVKN